MNNMERLFEECDEALSNACVGLNGYEKQDIAAVADGMKCLITHERFTDFERGMQFVNAVVGAVTFGQGALALDFSKMTAKEIAVELVKIWGVDAIADASAYTAGYACDELGMPAGVSFLASMLTGCTVSVGIGGYVFTDSSGKIVKELDADEMQTWLKSIDVDLDDMTGGGGYKGGSATCWADLMSPEDAAKYNIWVDLREDGIDQVLINDITLKNKGCRPDPATYLSKEYIDAHLAQFEEGASIIMTKEQYITYVKGNSYIGIPTDGTQFVMPKNFCDDLATKAGGNISTYETALGFDIGHFEDGGSLIRIDIDDLSGLNLRMPSGNEANANTHWIPGGKTDGGIPEAITDLIPNNPDNITIIEIE